MLLISFIFGLIFGVGSGVFERLLAEPLRRSFLLSDSELSILSFGGLLLLASVLVSAMGADSSAFWLVLGGMIGAFAIRVVAFGRAKMDERQAARDAAEEQAHDVTDEVSEELEKTGS